MSKQHFGEAYGANPAENYERFFVPAIGAPLAKNLIRLAAIQPGERVLDVACGTGVVARLAAEQVGVEGTVAAVDVNPGMLAVARSTIRPDISIEWHEANAEAMPLPDEAFDVVLCQMGLQFVPDKPAALREMRRVAVTNGRIFLNMPGPAGAIFAILSNALERHIGSEAAGFVQHVFSLHETGEIQQLMSAGGFRDVHVEANTGTLKLPTPKEFLWQYVSSTPLAGVVGKANESACAALEQEVLSEWREYEENGALMSPQRIVVVSARK
ncbi:MAG TPA: methyltransferase domain-containing protein [Gammaproteobacteria bacterium]|jgi:ubiquinone/menaquinone biosynthesis C-methylase UbiE